MTQEVSTKQRLLDLIEALKLPIIPEDAMIKLEDMTEEDIRSLIPHFEYVLGYQKTLDQEAEHADPDRFALVEATYQKELRELHENFLNRLENIQKNYDDQMDKLEEEEVKEIDKLVSEEDNTLNKLEKEYVALTSKIKNN